jgi:hypothetical protein
MLGVCEEAKEGSRFFQLSTHPLQVVRRNELTKEEHCQHENEAEKYPCLFEGVIRLLRKKECVHLQSPRASEA